MKKKTALLLAAGSGIVLLAGFIIALSDERLIDVLAVGSMEVENRDRIDIADSALAQIPRARLPVSNLPPTVSAESGASEVHYLEHAETELEIQINESIDGYLYINHLLDQVIEYSNLEVDEHVDFEYDDDEVAAYRILGMPKGTIGHFFVGLQPVYREGKEYRYFQMEIQTQAEALPAFYRDSIRAGPRIHLTLDFDEQGKPGRLALLTERRIDLRESRASGIDAYQGRFTSGAGYWVDLDTPHNASSETYGLINGIYAHGQTFQGISPLNGDIILDPRKIDTLLSRFQAHFNKVRRKQ